MHMLAFLVLALVVAAQTTRQICTCWRSSCLRSARQPRARADQCGPADLNGARQGGHAHAGVPRARAHRRGSVHGGPRKPGPREPRASSARLAHRRAGAGAHPFVFRAILDSERSSLFALSPELVDEVEAYCCDASSRVDPKLAQHAAARLANRAAARLGKLLTSLLRAHRLHRVAEPRRRYGVPAHGRAAPRPLEGAQVGQPRRPGRGGGDVLRRPRASPPNSHALRRGGSSLRGSALTTNLVVAPHVRWRDDRRGPSTLHGPSTRQAHLEASVKRLPHGLRTGRARAMRYIILQFTPSGAVTVKAHSLHH